MKKTVTVVLTCLDEAELVREAIVKIRSVLDKTIFEPHFYIVDDGSRAPERTRGILGRMAKVRIAYHGKNLGRGRSVSDGILAAQTPYVAFVDPDLEIPADELFDCFLALEEGADVAIAKRFYQLALKDLVRVVLSRGYSILVQLLLGLPYTDTEAGLKAFKVERIRQLVTQVKDARWFWDTEIVARSHYAGLQITEVPTVVVKRDDKQTTVHLFRDAWVYFWSLWSFRRTARALRRS